MFGNPRIDTNYKIQYTTPCAFCHSDVYTDPPSNSD